MEVVLILTWLFSQLPTSDTDTDEGSEQTRVYASTNDIRQDLDISVARLRKIITLLAATGCIEYEPKRGSKSQFTLLWPLTPTPHVEHASQPEAEEPTPEPQLVEPTPPPPPQPTEEGESFKALLEEETRQRTEELERLRRSLSRTLEALEGVTREQSALREMIRELQSAAPTASVTDVSDDPAAEGDDGVANRPLTEPGIQAEETAQATDRGDADASKGEDELAALFDIFTRLDQGTGVKMKTLRVAAHEELGLDRAQCEALGEALIRQGRLVLKGRTSGRRYMRVDQDTPSAEEAPRAKASAKTKPSNLRSTILKAMHEHMTPKGLAPRTIINRLSKQGRFAPSSVQAELHAMLKERLIVGQGHGRGRRYLLPGHEVTEKSSAADPDVREEAILKDMRTLMTPQGVRPKDILTRLLVRESISESSGRNILHAMVKSGAIVGEGHARARRYFLPDHALTPDPKPAAQPQQQTPEKHPSQVPARRSLSRQERAVVKDMHELMQAGGVSHKDLLTRLVERENLSDGEGRARLHTMVEEGLLIARGRAKARRYLLPDDEASTQPEDTETQADDTKTQTNATTSSMDTPAPSEATATDVSSQTPDDETLTRQEIGHLQVAYQTLVGLTGDAFVSIAELWRIASEPERRPMLNWLAGEVREGRAQLSSKGTSALQEGDEWAVLNVDGEELGWVHFWV